ncbi:VirB8/TrbF family protein [Comamonas endophytica]|uniref:VirB8/TrbF family protein n=1 Tax=Comamonas endophytica TaxID=2949090 RepID=A0ABY6GGE6_9BURK|nr:MULTISPECIES: VirB8/TrbF family protein [unclassified Acidovorax]MCD2514661.1 conjugal transfer protein [Acidovorax sp. D4N7]UYG53973.1 VirB8/TrbF family protein [Acidovorax sp. 5MLIR]
MRSKQKAPTSKAISETPYLAARREWNERYGDYISRANNWRLVAFGCVATSSILAAGLVWISGQQKVIPYIVETNGYGEVIRVSPANSLGRPSEKQIKSTLRQWITGARTVYVDARAQQQIVAATYATTLPDSPAYTTLSTYHRDHNPYQRAKKETAEVAWHGASLIGGDTWQIEWTETVHSRDGKPISDPTTYTATIMTSLATPTDEDTITLNPFGIYVKQFSWNQRIN